MKAALDLAAETSSSRRRRHRLMHSAMLGVVSCWAANKVAIKEALHGFSPLALVGVGAISAALLFGFLFLAFRCRSLVRPRGRQWVYFVVKAFCDISVGQILFIRTSSLTSIPHATLILAVEPVMVLVLSVLIRLEFLSLLKSLGMAISLSGVVVLSYVRSRHGNHAY